MTASIEINTPDDWHLHFRDDDFLLETVPATARCFQRAIVMPNLMPPITTAAMALQYKTRILAAKPVNNTFMPLMTLFLTNKTSAQDIRDAKQAGVVAVKLYPAGATTNSAAAVSDLAYLDPVFEALIEEDLLLLIHGEVTNHDVDIFDREKLFIDRHLCTIVEKFPALKIVFEHITTREAVEFVVSASTSVAATITPQHLLLNRNDLLVGGVQPHNYCLPVLKRSVHQRALQDIVVSGSSKFFLGTDSAPHEQHRKESACGCAGCYSAWSAIELYAQIFDDLGAIDRLEGFASHYGADFYGLPRNRSVISLVKEKWQVPAGIVLPNGSNIVPFFAGKTLNWRLCQ